MTIVWVSLIVIIFFLFTVQLRGYGQRQEADITSFKYLVSIVVDDVCVCGGTIITPRHILSAAHCASKRNGSIHIIAGSAKTNPFWLSRQKRRVQAVHTHPNFSTHKNVMIKDAAVYTVSQPFHMGEKVNIVKYAPFQSDLFVDFMQRMRINCTFVGWGRPDRKGKLHYTDIHPIPAGTCNSYLGGKMIQQLDHICGVSDGLNYTCQGDSGGPLICLNVQWGIASMSDARLVGVFTRVDSIADWINKVILTDSGKT